MGIPIGTTDLTNRLASLARHAADPPSAGCEPAINVKEEATMKTGSSKTPSAAIAALLLCAVCGTARANLIYVPPVTADAISYVLDNEREEQAADRVLAERRQAMIGDCEQNNGTDCEREVDTELRAESLQGFGVIHLRPAR
jgi:hypothetical protein